LCLIVVCLLDVCFVIGRRAVGIMGVLPLLHFSWSARSSLGPESYCASSRFLQLTTSDLTWNSNIFSTLYFAYGTTLNTTEASASAKGGGDKAATSNKKSKPDGQKRDERLAANRRSARESRNRKKQVFEELQRSVQRLAEENGMLRRENDTLKMQMIGLRRQLAGDSKDGGEGGAGGDPTQISLEQQQQIAMYQMQQMQQMMAMNPAFFAQMQQAQQAAAAVAAPSGDNADGAGGDDA